MAHSVGAGENGCLYEGHESQTLALEWGGYAPPKATSKTSGTGRSLYLIDNEVHHRGQGYVCLRALGVEPPPFRER